MNKIVLNGKKVNIGEKATVQDLLDQMANGKTDGIAVAMNGSIISRSAWGTQEILCGAKIDILEAFQGG